MKSEKNLKNYFRSMRSVVIECGIKSHASFKFRLRVLGEKTFNNLFVFRTLKGGKRKPGWAARLAFGGVANTVKQQ